jgi:hypothetical protein
MFGGYMDKRKDRWHNAWTHQEDSLLWEAVEITGSRKTKAWLWLKDKGVNRTVKAVANRVQYLEVKNNPHVIKVTKEPMPKGWGFYV